jgi:hypothetical protein
MPDLKINQLSIISYHFFNYDLSFLTPNANHKKEKKIAGSCPKFIVWGNHAMQVSEGH